MSKKFIPINRSTSIILPSNLEGYSTPGMELSRFIVEIVEQLDTTSIEEAYNGSGGSKSYPPKMMLCLLFYCYIIGTFSSRSIERATYELIPVIYITNGNHPDHDTINTFRKRFLDKLEGLFLQILLIAHEMGILKLGDVSLDGTKIEANASKHSSMSWEYANKLEEQLQAEVRKLIEMSNSPSAETPKGLDIKEEMDRRAGRLTKIAEVKKEIEKRAQVRYEQEQREYEEKIKKRSQTEEQRGKKIGGRPPNAPIAGPRPKDQVNFTDGDSRIMPKSGGKEFIQSYNAQASVDVETLIIVGEHVTQNPNDKQEIEPAVEELKKIPEELGKVKKMNADSGYFSGDNIIKLECEGIEPYIRSGRQSHNPPLDERISFLIDLETGEQAIDAAVSDAVTIKYSKENNEVETKSERDLISQRAAESTTELEKIKNERVENRHKRMKTKEGKAFYAKRKTTIEPVFGIIKNVISFRRFMLRGIEKVKGEWTLVCIAFNLKRIFTLDAS